MANENGEKEVYFHLYCRTCKYRDKEQFEEPCNTCLENCSNLYSHVPVKYEAKDAKTNGAR